MNRKLLNLCVPSFVAISYSHQWWTEPMSPLGTSWQDAGDQLVFGMGK